MTMRSRRFLLAPILALALASALATPARAAETYTFDTVHSQIIFFVNHLGISITEGEFQEWDGHFVFDEANIENSSVDVTIDANSIDMDNAIWDDHMKAADWFNVAEHPTLTFRSTQVEGTGENTGKVTGDFTLLGQTAPVTLDVTFLHKGSHPMRPDQTRAGFSARAKLKRSDFGMTFGLPAIGNDIEIRIEVEAIRSDDEGKPSNE